MTGPLGRVLLFTLAVVGVFVYLGEVLTKISGEGARAAKTSVAAGGSPEAGEALYWGKGKCHTCHRIGRRGSAIRGPDHENTGARAVQRARERAVKGTPPRPGMTATAYLVESLVDPGAYVVEGFKNEMPAVWKPPVSLKPDEIRALVAYLQSLGGTVDVAAITLPPEVEQAARAGEVRVAGLRPYLPGDPEKGRELFFSPEGNAACGKCHLAQGKGGNVGPELTHVAGTRPVEFIIESILDPSKEIASGFESILVVTRDGRYLSGILKKDDSGGVELVDKDGAPVKIPAQEIREKAVQKTSLMPGNFKEILTVEEFHHLLAFLQTLR
ncbi:MAG: c-type cytochrome [Deltaproteobacteria bacterium]|nr:c-type cytochrome [Deltaproteobacteria bacterium]MBI3077335.1 c-type cytochrome [Deltaproteobacteria bacterium]